MDEMEEKLTKEDVEPKWAELGIGGPDTAKMKEVQKGKMTKVRDAFKSIPGKLTSLPGKIKDILTRKKARSAEEGPEAEGVEGTKKEGRFAKWGKSIKKAFTRKKAKREEEGPGAAEGEVTKKEGRLAKLGQSIKNFPGKIKDAFTRKKAKPAEEEDDSRVEMDEMEITYSEDKGTTKRFQGIRDALSSFKDGVSNRFEKIASKFRRNPAEVEHESEGEDLFLEETDMEDGETKLEVKEGTLGERYRKVVDQLEGSPMFQAKNTKKPKKVSFLNDELEKMESKLPGAVRRGMARNRIEDVGGEDDESPAAVDIDAMFTSRGGKEGDFEGIDNPKEKKTTDVAESRWGKLKRAIGLNKKGYDINKAEEEEGKNKFDPDHENDFKPEGKWDRLKGAAKETWSKLKNKVTKSRSEDGEAEPPKEEAPTTKDSKLRRAGRAIASLPGKAGRALKSVPGKIKKAFSKESKVVHNPTYGEDESETLEMSKPILQEELTIKEPKATKAPWHKRLFGIGTGTNKAAEEELKAQKAIALQEQIQSKSSEYLNALENDLIVVSNVANEWNKGQVAHSLALEFDDVSKGFKKLIPSKSFFNLFSQDTPIQAKMKKVHTSLKQLSFVLSKTIHESDLSKSTEISTTQQSIKLNVELGNRIQEFRDFFENVFTDDDAEYSPKGEDGADLIDKNTKLDLYKGKEFAKNKEIAEQDGEFPDYYAWGKVLLSETQKALKNQAKDEDDENPYEAYSLDKNIVDTNNSEKEAPRAGTEEDQKWKAFEDNFDDDDFEASVSDKELNALRFGGENPEGSGPVDDDGDYVARDKFEGWEEKNPKSPIVSEDWIDTQWKKSSIRLDKTYRKEEGQEDEDGEDDF